MTCRTVNILQVCRNVDQHFLLGSDLTSNLNNSFTSQTLLSLDSVHRERTFLRGLFLNKPSMFDIHSHTHY